VEFYRGGDPDAGVVGESDAVCLGVGEAVCVGFLTRTHGLSRGDALFESGSAGDLVVNADAAVACGGTPPSTPRRLSTGVADWRVTGVPDEKSAGATTPRDATVVTPPSAWVTSTADAAWVDPFGDGGTTSDPEGTYEYELAFDGPGTLVVEEYASDNPVEFSLDGTPIGGTDDPRAYRTLRSNVPAQSVEPDAHGLGALVLDLEDVVHDRERVRVDARAEERVVRRRDVERDRPAPGRHVVAVRTVARSEPEERVRVVRDRDAHRATRLDARERARAEREARRAGEAAQAVEELSSVHAGLVR
jgi:hypothetical protein